MYPCRVCTSPLRAEIDAALNDGISDYEVSRRFAISRPSIHRHRVRHIIKPMQDKLAILAKDSEEQRQRRELARAADADAPSMQELIETHLSMRAQIAHLAEIRQDLTDGRTIAKEARSPTGIAQIAGQSLRHVEVASRLGGVGGYRPPTATAGIGGELGPRWSIEINFRGSGRTETINVVGPVGGGDTVREASEDDSIIEGSAEADEEA
jgi:hypothetical protein